MRFNIKKLEKIRIEKDLTIRQMAGRIGISHQKYYDLLKEYGSPKLDTISRIANNLNLKPNELIEF
jgi:transcriptional regulator with XRE-family HTH domain